MTSTICQASSLIVMTLFYFFSYPLAAETFTIAISDKNINLAYNTVNNSKQSYLTSVDSSLLYTKYNNHQDLLAGIGLHFMQQNNTNNRFTYKAAIKAFVADPLDYYLTSLAVGGLLLFEPESSPQIKLETTIYYSPESLTFSDGDRFWLIDIAMDYYLQHELAMNIGYRRIRTQIKNMPDTDFDRGGYIGLRLLF